MLGLSIRFVKPEIGSFVPTMARSSENGAAETEQFGRPSACILAGFAGFLDEFLLLDQAAEILFVNEPPGQSFDAALQLQQRECFGHQFEHHRMIFDFGP